MTAEFVPASNLLGESVWLGQDGEMRWIYGDPDTARECQKRGWRRLGYMRPVEHPDLIDSDDTCWRWCDGTYHTVGSGCSREVIEAHWGPVREVAS